jgi:hypothetical protein
MSEEELDALEQEEIRDERTFRYAMLLGFAVFVIMLAMAVALSVSGWWEGIGLPIAGPVMSGLMSAAGLAAGIVGASGLALCHREKSLIDKAREELNSQ